MASRTGILETDARAGDSGAPEEVEYRRMGDGEPYEGSSKHQPPAATDPGCSIKQLPARLMMKAAEVASRVNPVNAPVIGRAALVTGGVLPTPLAAAVVTAKYWGPIPRKLTVSFMDNPAADLRRRILTHMNAWTRTCCVEFVETAGTGQVRITRGAGGYWSYLGTDILLIPTNRPTMNLQAFSMSTPESEYKRVVRHETGHTLGMPHEHMRKQLVARIDPAKAYDYFWRTQHWDRATVDAQVLTPLNDATIMGTPVDQDSIMCYNLPASITRDSQPIRGGFDINNSDFAFAGMIYPRIFGNTRDSSQAGSGEVTQVADMSSEDEWPESEDITSVDLSQA